MHFCCKPGIHPKPSTRHGDSFPSPAIGSQMIIRRSCPPITSVCMDNVSAFVSKHGVATAFSTDMSFETYLEMTDVFFDIMQRMHRDSTDADDLEKQTLDILTSNCSQAAKEDKASRSCMRDQHDAFAGSDRDTCPALSSTLDGVAVRRLRERIASSAA